MRMPVLFVGHGNPMNALEDNEITRSWREIAQRLPRPNAILAISAHWYGRNTRVQSAEKPRQIYDFYGFPEALNNLTYEPKGHRALTEAVQRLLSVDVLIDNDWGIDHGTWSVLSHMYPDADIPVVQFAINMALPEKELLAIGKALATLRDEGILIFGSGNIVHNLRQVDWQKDDGTPEAKAFDDWVLDKIRQKDFLALADYRTHPHARYAVPTSDHYIPLLYCLGAVEEKDNISVFNRALTMGSISMTSYLFD
jgi:4,5-DOPA dioxygenase extradiol